MAAIPSREIRSTRAPIIESVVLIADFGSREIIGQFTATGSVSPGVKVCPIDGGEGVWPGNLRQDDAPLAEKGPIGGRRSTCYQPTPVLMFKPVKPIDVAMNSPNHSLSQR